MLRYCKLSSVTVLQEILVIVSNVSIVSSVSVANNMWYLKKSTLKKSIFKEGTQLILSRLGHIFTFLREGSEVYIYAYYSAESGQDFT